MRWANVSESGKREVLEYVKILMNILIGLLLSAELIVYHEYIIESVVTVSYQVNSLILNWAIEVPDYT
jgi:cell division protein FtsL